MVWPLDDHWIVYNTSLKLGSWSQIAMELDGGFLASLAGLRIRFVALAPSSVLAPRHLSRSLVPRIHPSDAVATDIVMVE